MGVFALDISGCSVKAMRTGMAVATNWNDWAQGRWRTCDAGE
jgi:hypothetical protein